ncbi:MAG: hypothetical protein NC293_06530 [Roseburia sp.]|nr:hypothetical protein [Roseburia sp.]
MSGERINESFVITGAIPVGNKEFVLGVNRKAASSFVTWECRGRDDYFWGRYTDSPLKAARDLCERAMAEIVYLEQRENRQKPVERGKER